MRSMLVSPNASGGQNASEWLPTARMMTPLAIMRSRTAKASTPHGRDSGAATVRGDPSARLKRLESVHQSATDLERAGPFFLDDAEVPSAAADAVAWPERCHSSAAATVSMARNIGSGSLESSPSRTPSTATNPSAA
jgi:hypothetical protein